MDSVDVAIVGGGAAGFFAAITCAEANPRLRIAILEKGAQVLSKVKISGGGRCNVTHGCFDPARLVSFYPRGGRELRGPFHRWQPRDTVDWFGRCGVPLKTEADGRMFPVTDDSQTIVDCLVSAARRQGISIHPQCGVRDIKIEHGEDPGFLLEGQGQGAPFPLRAGRLLIACGGLKGDRLLNAIVQLGHTIEPLAPSLFSFHIADPRLDGLSGISVPSAEVRIPETSDAQRGPMLITHRGLSGPAILKLSAWAARWIQSQGYRFPFRVAWVSGMDVEAGVRSLMGEVRRQWGRKQVDRQPAWGLPQRLWRRLAATALETEESGETWGRLSKARARRLAENVLAGEYRVTGKTMNKEEFVTCGGVRLKEVNFKTMESRWVPGLYFAGEVLDIDAVTGGFNFQAAWTTGRLAGLAMGSVNDF